MIAKFLVLTGTAPGFKAENGYEHKSLVSEWYSALVLPGAAF